jgi:hypothetical protein
MLGSVDRSALVPDMVFSPAARQQGKQVVKPEHHQQGTTEVLQELFSCYLCVELIAHVIAHNFVFLPFGLNLSFAFDVLQMLFLLLVLTT